MAGSSTSHALEFQQPNSTSAVPASTFVARSQAPYSGPDLLTALPVEILQRVASNLHAHEIRALRATNKAANRKSFFNFVKTCLHTLQIDCTKVGFQRGQHNLRVEHANTATKQVIFSLPDTSIVDLKRHTGPAAQVNVPSGDDIQTVLDLLPNVNTIVVRDPMKYDQLSQTIFETLATAPCTQLTDLTLDGCRVKPYLLAGVLQAHRQSLRYLALRDIWIERHRFMLQLIRLLESDFSLTRFVLDRVRQDEIGCHTFRVMYARVIAGHGYGDRIVLNDHCKECGTVQRYVLGEHLMSISGCCAMMKGVVEMLENL